MQITAIQAVERLNSITQKLISPSFSDRCSLVEHTLRNREFSHLELAFSFADPIMNLVDILKHSNFPEDATFYEKLFSFTDPCILIGFKSSLDQSAAYLKEEGSQLYEVPEDDYQFFRDYAFIAFI